MIYDPERGKDDNEIIEATLWNSIGEDDVKEAGDFSMADDQLFVIA